MAIVKNITVVNDFHDGNLANKFKALGYPPKWKAGERRNLPEELVRAVTGSGGVVAIAEPNAKESRIVESAEPTGVDESHFAQKYGKAKRHRVVFPEGFRDGTLAPELAAVGHPPVIGVGEIVELPLSLLEKMQNSGAVFSSLPEEIDQSKAFQGKHQQAVREWQAEQERINSERAGKAANKQHNAAVQAEIDGLSSEFLSAVGPEKEVLWERIRMLKASMR